MANKKLTPTGGKNTSRIKDIFGKYMTTFFPMLALSFLYYYSWLLAPTDVSKERKK
jgi:hypothetical protein